MRGPMIAAVTAGWRITNPSASSISVMPACSASCASASVASSLRWFPGSSMSYMCGTSALRREATSWPLRKRPVSQPPASGLQGITPMP